MSIGMVRRGSELWMYYTGYPVTHGYDIKTVRGLGVISRLVQRLDGFVSADAAYGGGELTTIPVLFRGARLEINVDTGALGSLRVELLDPEHHPLPGFTSEDCYPIIGNSVARRVAWKGGHDVGALAGRPIRLRFRMRATKLYAFQFVS
jgi:hypothetical protein